MKSAKWWMGLCAAGCVCATVGASAALPRALETSGGVRWTFSIGDNGAIVWVASPATGALTVPSTLRGQPVVEIADYAFDNCTNLTSVTIPDSVTNIGISAFSGCTNLTSVTIPDSVTSIGVRAFEDCRGLTSVTIPDSVTSIGVRAFSGCSGLTSVTISDSLTSILDSAFSGCSGLTSVTIPDSVTSIGSYAFFGCSGLTSVTIPDSVIVIMGSAFSYCTNLTSMTIPDSVTSIGRSAFNYCSGLTSVTIGDSVTSIGWDVFFGCSGLKTLYAPESWKTKYVEDGDYFWSDYADVPSGCEIIYGAPPEAPKTSTGVPYAWLEEQGLGDGTAEGYEAAAAADAANGAYKVWECYVAGLDPADPAARFTAVIGFTNGTPVVSWTPDLNEKGAKSERSYEVEGRPTMTNAWGGTNAASRFFRVKVALPQP